MTSVATIAAAVPLAFGLGPGSETRAPLARAIIGGIALSTLITLVVVPVFYVMFEHLTQLIRGSSWRTRHGAIKPSPVKLPEPAELEVVES